jgi:hypothetical protein
MIDGVIAGKVCGRPEERPGKGGKAFVAARMVATAGDGGGVLINVVAYAHEARAILLGLEDGDTAVLQGILTPKAWTDGAGAVKPALDMVANSVLTVCQAARASQTLGRERPCR